MINILMIEDDPDFYIFLGEYLEKYNIKITNCEDPYIALISKIDFYDLIILDLTLPGIDGLDVCKEISNKYDIPIIVSSARSDISDKIIALQVGANYYLAKPYDPREMYAVIQSLLRRQKKLPFSTIQSDFEYENNSISFKKQVMNLTQAEHEVIYVLLQAKNAICSREQIVNSCESLSDSNSKSLDVIIGRLRIKLNDNPKNPKYLFSIRGMGYKIIQ